MSMDFGLSGSTAIVTGAASGIGHAVSALLAQQGAIVISVDRDVASDPDSMVASRITGDVADPDVASTAVGAALEATGRVDLLVNCAGIVDQREGFLCYDTNDWRKIWNVNVLGYVNMSRAVLPVMLKQEAGTLVHLGSVRSKLPVPSQVVYATTKAAVTSLSKSLALEFGSAGLRSNVVSPGAVRTAIWDREGGLADMYADRHGLPRDEAIQHELTVVRKIPAGRPATVEEIAAAVAFLASPLLSGYTNGSDLVVDGAMIPSIV